MLINYKNIRTLFIACAFIAVPTLSTAMEQEPNQHRDLTYYPRIVASTVKNTTVYVVETACEWPKATLVAGGFVTGVVLWRHFIASQQDLKDTGVRLNEHREREMARVSTIKKTHDDDTQLKFGQFATRQEALVTLITQTQNGLNVTEKSFNDLFKQAEIFGLSQSAVFNVIHNATMRAARDAQAEADGLNGIQGAARGVVNQQGGTQRLAVLVLNNMGTAQDDLQALLREIRSTGQDTETIEQQVVELLQRLNVQDQLETQQNAQAPAEGSQDRFELVPDDN